MESREMVKIAFACENNKGLDSNISARFGRAPFFAIVEVTNGEVKEVRVIENPGASQPSGAGIRAVQKLVKERVEAVVAGGFGPNALAALEELGIKRVELSGIKVGEAVQRALKEL